MKKYELTDEKKQIAGRTLFRIRALRDFYDVKAGDLGGWIESENNLSYSGDAWVSGDARVSDDAVVSGDAWVFGDARVSGDAWIFGQGAICTVSNIGSRYGITTFFNRKDGTIGVRCGCFYGSIDEFAEAVRNRHGGNKFAKQYELAIELAKVSIETRKEGE